MNSKQWGMLGYLTGQRLRDMRTAIVCPTLAAKDTWYKGTAFKSTITAINIVDTYTPTGNETESWAADVDGTGSIMCYITGTVLTIVGNGSGKIKANEDASKMFESFTGLTSIVGLRLLDTTNTTNFARMFYSCKALMDADVSAFDTSNATTMERMFFDCQSLLALDVSNFSTVNVTNMENMFYRCAKLTTLDVSGFRTDKVTTMNRMFFECNAVVNLDVSNFNTANVTDMDHMFARCYALTAVTLTSFDTSKVTTFLSMFENCYQLTSLDLTSFVTSRAYNGSGMFYGCRKLNAIYVGDGWTFSAEYGETYDMFYDCGVSEVTYV